MLAWTLDYVFAATSHARRDHLYLARMKCFLLPGMQEKLKVLRAVLLGILDTLLRRMPVAEFVPRLLGDWVTSLQLLHTPGEVLGAARLLGRWIASLGRLNAPWEILGNWPGGERGSGRRETRWIGHTGRTGIARRHSEKGVAAEIDPLFCRNCSGAFLGAAGTHCRWRCHFVP